MRRTTTDRTTHHAKRRRRSGFLALAAVLATSACDRQTTLPEDFERNRQRWEASAPSHYTYAVERLCYCAFRGPARVTVRDGIVESVEIIEPTWIGPQPPADELAGLFPSVDGLFDILEDASRRGAHAIDVTWDPETGVPLELFVDYHEQMADDELGMRVTEPVVSLPNG